jgi:hypothetical protein
VKETASRYFATPRVGVTGIWQAICAIIASGSGCARDD